MQNELREMYENMLAGIVQFLPKLLLAFLIAIIGFIIAKVVQRLIKKFILYLNNVLNSKLENALLNVDLQGSAKFISKTFFWIILIITMMSCIQVLQVNFLTMWFGAVVSYLPNVAAAVVIVFVGIIVGRLAGDLISSAASRTGLANGQFIGRLVRYLIVFIAIVIDIDQLGLDVSFLTTLITILVSSLLFGAAIAFGLGAKTSISNILGSYYVKKSLSVGDKVQIGANKGVIVKINDHAVSLETKTGLVMIPAKAFNETEVSLIKMQKS